MAAPPPSHSPPAAQSSGGGTPGTCPPPPGPAIAFSSSFKRIQTGEHHGGKAWGGGLRGGAGPAAGGGRAADGAKCSGGGRGAQKLGGKLDGMGGVEGTREGWSLLWGGANNRQRKSSHQGPPPRAKEGGARPVPAPPACSGWPWLFGVPPTPKRGQLWEQGGFQQRSLPGGGGHSPSCPPQNKKEFPSRCSMQSAPPQLPSSLGHCGGGGRGNLCPHHCLGGAPKPPCWAWRGAAPRFRVQRRGGVLTGHPPVQKRRHRINRGTGGGGGGEGGQRGGC